MSDINNLVISGRLTRNAEQRFTPSGKAVLSFSIANTTGYGDNAKVQYFNCSVFGKRAESEKLLQALSKGTPATVQGEISLNEYQSNGQNKASLNVFVKELSFVSVGSKPQNAHNQHKANGYAPQVNPEGFADFDSDIPF